MKYKAGLTGLIALGAVSVQVLMPVVAHANTSVEYAPTSIQVTGQSPLNPKHVVSNDPWSGKPTSWLPVYYLQQALKSIGVQTTWNGNTLDVTSTPSGWNVNVSGAPQTGTAPTGQMQFSINGNQYDFIRAPKLVAKDPASGVETTYVPVYYADLFLQQRLLMGVAWDGDTWNMATQKDISKIQITATPSTANVGQKVTISGKLLLQNGAGAPDAPLSVLGLPNTNNKTISTNLQGDFSFTTTFDKSGTYQVSVGDGKVSWQVNVTVK